FARIGGSRFEKGAGLVTRNGKIAAHFERTIFSMFSVMNGLNRMQMGVPDWMFHPVSVIALSYRAGIGRTGNSSKREMFRKGHGAHTGTTILSSLRVARWENRPPETRRQAGFERLLR